MNKLAKNPPKSRDATKQAAQTVGKIVVPTTHATRETVESIVIAFVLAFLFRTFEAEAFVIPTGSMAPTLMGMHKDVDCPKCGFRYRVSASEEGDETEQRKNEISRLEAQLRSGNPQNNNAIRQRIEQLQRLIGGWQIAGGVCPMCRYVMPMRSDLPPAALDDPTHATDQKSFNGDRILVNKYRYTIDDPNRFDVVVFHFPGNAEVNYIKRLVGLPNETLRVYQGDLLVGAPGASREEDFAIARKPPDKFLAVRQLVHDTDYDPAELFQARWPLRWYAASPTGADGWQSDPKVDGSLVRQRYSVDRTAGGEAWLRYRHVVPSDNAWHTLAGLQKSAAPGVPAQFSDANRVDMRPELIMDFNAYNTRVHYGDIQPTLHSEPEKLGLHWVGDLMVEAEVSVEQAKGELLLDLVEAGKHFTCRVDLTTGQATLGAEGWAEFAPQAKTPITGPGKYRVGFANVDDQLLLWVDGQLVDFEKQSTAYDAVKVFGGRAISPKTSDGPDKGDLSPAGIGANGSQLAVTRLRVWRDIYYIADRYFADGGGQRHNGPISDWDRIDPALRYNPRLWDEFFLHRRHVDFPLGADQFFVMGDNSAESSDARLWQEPHFTEDGQPSGQPGGAYLERKLLIGKAVCVYWPHAWYTIPFTSIPVWPNFRDMRLVK